MGRLSGKKALVFGVANDKSIAWGIARALHREGADLAFTFAGEALEKRVRPLAESVGSKIVLPCDVSRDEDIEKVYQEIQKTWGNFDYLVHSVAFAKKRRTFRELLPNQPGRFSNRSRDFGIQLGGGHTRGRSVDEPGRLHRHLDVLRIGKVVPNYNVMGVAKAALEACVRYLAYDLGPKNIRVNAVSAGPIKTLAASGVGKFKSMLKVAGEMTPLKRNVTQEEVGEAALFLLSDAALRHHRRSALRGRRRQYRSDEPRGKRKILFNAFLRLSFRRVLPCHRSAADSAFPVSRVFFLKKQQTTRCGVFLFSEKVLFQPPFFQKFLSTMV